LRSLNPKETRFVKALVDSGLISFKEAGQLEHLHERHQTDTGEHKAVWDIAVDAGVVTSAQVTRVQMKAADPGVAASRDTSQTAPGGDTQNLAPQASALARAIASPEGEGDAAGAAKSGGKRLGGYRLVSKLGQGGMGAVYRAVQESMDRTVAIKVLPRNLAQNQDFIGRFLREARAAGKLSHPNIVAGIDAGFADGYYYFAMEYVEGSNLGDRLDAEGALAEAEAIEITVQIAEALEHAHEEGIIHRDVKPENILVTESGTAKLCDLGLARSTGGDMRLTQAGMAVGTAYYMSPEQSRGQEPELSADIYSLGATLYHLVLGRPPFDGENSMQVMQKHINEVPPKPSEVCPGAISSALEAVILKMIAKRPEQRYESMAEVAAELQSVRAGGIPATLKVSVAERRRSGRRGTRSTAAVRAVATRVGTAVRDPALRATRKRASGKLLPVIGAIAILVAIALALLIFKGSDVPGTPAGGRKGIDPGIATPAAVPGGTKRESGSPPPEPLPVIPTGPSAFTASWRQLSIPDGPKARGVGFSNMTYDSKRKRCVLWGGCWPHQNDLWVLDLGASRWTCLQETDLTAPGVGTSRPGRAGHTEQIWMVYDDKNDLYWTGWRWRYDPVKGAWKKHEKKFSGFGHYGWWVRPGWAYLPGSGQVVLCGSASAIANLKSRVATRLPKGPCARWADGGMVYDRASKVFVLFGGVVSGRGLLDDTWIYDPVAKAWTEVQSKKTPRARARHKLLWHGGINAVVMAGGVAKKGQGRFNDLWVFETARRKWTEVKLAESPPAIPMAVTYDAARGAVAAFNRSGQTWALRITRKRAINRK
jgi:eukaryotic-like serine/threonine-protein kinase